MPSVLAVAIQNLNLDILLNVFRALKKSDEDILNVFGNLAANPFTVLKEDDYAFGKLEEFFVQVYGGNAKKIDTLRRQCFAAHQNVERLPPTRVSDLIVGFQKNFSGKLNKCAYVLYISERIISLCVEGDLPGRNLGYE